MQYQDQNQPTINIGMIGSVSNGKSTIVEKITGTKTQRHSKELQNNISIKLGYANAKIYKCPNCKSPECYQGHPSNVYIAQCKYCSADLVLQKHVSFVDCPGHNILLSTMLNGTCIMDTVIIVESFLNTTIPNPQTQEHLMATHLKNIPIAFSCINKADLVKKKEAISKMNDFEDYLKKKDIKKPIIPLSANKEINIDVICEYICTQIPDQPIDYLVNKDPKMIVIRSFNINKPNCKFNELVGGVVGGSILQGVFSVGDKVKILPGLINKNTYEPIYTKIISINSEDIQLQKAHVSGLIGVGLDIDPSLSACDRMVGQIVLKCDEQNPENNYGHGIFNLLTVELNQALSKNLKIGSNIVINYNGTNITTKIRKLKNNCVQLELSTLICVKKNSIITLSKERERGINNENNVGVILGGAKVLNGKIE